MEKKIDKKKAIALRYEKDNSAYQVPTVIASGEGLVAENILKAALEADIPVQQDPDLAKALSQVELGDAVPEDLFPVIAEVLVFISRMNSKRAKES
jgi:flagellar biosynthesis protein